MAGYVRSTAGPIVTRQKPRSNWKQKAEKVKAFKGYCGSRENTTFAMLLHKLTVFCSTLSPRWTLTARPPEATTVRAIPKTEL